MLITVFMFTHRSSGASRLNNSADKDTQSNQPYQIRVVYFLLNSGFILPVQPHLLVGESLVTVKLVVAIPNQKRKDEM